MVGADGSRMRTRRISEPSAILLPAASRVGAEIRLYQTELADKPRFYIDLIGQNTTIATLVANDFPHLVETMRQLHPLITLIGLDQSASARMWDQIAREIRFKH